MIFTFLSFLKLGKCVLIHNKSRTHKLFDELQSELQKSGFSLAEKHKKRIEFYTAQSAITNYWFSTLRGEKPSASEVKNALYLGAFTPIMDDLMDELNMTFENLLAQKSTDREEGVLFHFLMKKLQPIMQNSCAFRHFFERAHVAQNQSLRQLQKSPLSDDELEILSQQKGGYYTLLYRALLHNKLLAHEEECIYQLGGILQLSNDIFDMYKDFHQGVQTLAIKHPDIAFLKQLFHSYLLDFKDIYWQMPYAQSCKKNAFAAIMAIVCRTQVALDYYEKLQGKNQLLDIAAFSRKAMIADMEKPTNIWKTLVATNKAILPLSQSKS